MDQPTVTLLPWALRHDEVFALQVAEEQRAFIDPPTVAEFLADDDDHPTFNSFAVCAGTTVVGLACFGQEAGHKPWQWWIPLVVIDRRYQGNGFGRATLRAIIARIQAQSPDARALGLSCKPANTAAIHLYRSLGFQPGSTTPRGEVELWLDL